MARMKVRPYARTESGTSYLLDCPTGVAVGMLEVPEVLLEVVELPDVELEVLEVFLKVVELLDVGGIVLLELVGLLDVGDIVGDEELLSPTGDDR
jgi:hypothetical protein